MCVCVRFGTEDKEREREREREREERARERERERKRERGRERPRCSGRAAATVAELLEESARPSLFQRQKRPTIKAKETYYKGKRDLAELLEESARPSLFPVQSLGFRFRV